MKTNPSFLIKYLKANGWKEVEEGWRSPFSKNVYTLEEAMDVEKMIKGKEYVENKLDEKKPKVHQE